MSQEPQFSQTLSAQLHDAYQREFGTEVFAARSGPRPRGHKRKKPVKVKLDAFIAEIAKILDASLLEYDPDFESLWRPHRMHTILACLARCDIARAEEFVGRKVRWRPSRRLRQDFCVKHHGLPYELEQIQPPIGNSTLADGFSTVLRANAKEVNGVVDFAISAFERRLR